MWSYLFARRVIAVTCFLLLSLSACTLEKETVVPATRRVIEASPLPATATMARLAEPSLTVVTATIAATAAATATPVATHAPAAATVPAEPLIISPENAEQLTQLDRFGGGRIKGVSWSPDGTLFMVNSSRGLELYDARTLQLVYTIEDGAGSASFSPLGDLLLGVNCDDYFCYTSLWDTASGENLGVLGIGSSLEYTPDGQAVILEEPGTQLIWRDLRSGETLRNIALSCYSYRYRFAGEAFVYLCEDGKVYLYDAASGQLRHTLEESVNVEQIELSPQGEVLVVGLGQDRITTLRLYDVASGQLRHTIEVPAAAHGFYFNAEGELLIANSDDDAVRVWDAGSGELLWEGRNVVFNPDGRLVATLGDDNVVRLWDTQSGEVLHQLEGQPSGTYLAFSPDGRLFASDDLTRTAIEVWDTTTFQLVRRFDRLSLLAFNPDGNILARPQEAGGMRGLWDVASGELLRTFAEGQFFLYHVFAFSPDNRLLLGHGAGEVGEGYTTLWDVNSSETMEWSADYGPTITGAFSPDGRLLAVVKGDGSVQLWGVPNGTMETGD